MARKIDRCRSLARTIVLTGFVAAGLPGVVWAQQGPVTGGAPTAIADNNLLAFHSDPTVLLTGNPNGGLLLISQVQQLTLADSSTFPKILQLIPAANEPQKRAIGEGLALASKVKILKDEQLAAEWQRQIMGSGDPIVVASATAAFGDVQIGGIGGGALGGDGGGPSTVRNTAAVYFGSCAILWLLLASDRLIKRMDLPVDTLGAFYMAIRDAREALFLPGGMVLLCLTAMALTQSRAGTTFSLMALSIAGACFFWRYLPNRRFLPVLLLATSLPVAALLLLGGGVNSRFNLEGFSDEGRIEVYRSTLRMIADHPWFGVGLGGFPWILPRYRMPDLSMWGTWTRAHSTPLELAAEVGLPLAGLIALAWLAALVVLARGFRRRRRDRLIPLAALAVALLALIHSCGDFSLQIPGFAVVVFAIMGVGLAQSVSDREAQRRTRPVITHGKSDAASAART